MYIVQYSYFFCLKSDLTPGHTESLAVSSFYLSDSLFPAATSLVLSHLSVSLYLSVWFPLSSYLVVSSFYLSVSLSASLSDLFPPVGMFLYLFICLFDTFFPFVCLLFFCLPVSLSDCLSDCLLSFCLSVFFPFVCQILSLFAWLAPSFHLSVCHLSFCLSESLSVCLISSLFPPVYMSSFRLSVRFSLCLFAWIPLSACLSFLRLSDSLFISVLSFCLSVCSSMSYRYTAYLSTVWVFFFQHLEGQSHDTYIKQLRSYYRRILSCYFHINFFLSSTIKFIKYIIFK